LVISYSVGEIIDLLLLIDFKCSLLTQYAKKNHLIAISAAN